MHALIIGATGATGSELLSQLLADPDVSQVSVFVRRFPNIEHAKLTVHVIDFEAIDAHQDKIQGDVLFSCLGTTRKDAGSQETQRKIDHTYQYRFAKLAHKNGVPQLILVSSGFANPKSQNFYLQIKGQLEQDVMALGFERLAIVRPPSLIRPNTDRLGEKITLPIFNALNKLGLLQKMRPMPVQTLAKAMIALAKQPTKDVTILESLDIWDWAKR